MKMQSRADGIIDVFPQSTFLSNCTFDYES